MLEELVVEESRAEVEVELLWPRYDDDAKTGPATTRVAKATKTARIVLCMLPNTE